MPPTPHLPPTFLPFSSSYSSSSSYPSFFQKQIHRISSLVTPLSSLPKQIHRIFSLFSFLFSLAFVALPLLLSPACNRAPAPDSAPDTLRLTTSRIAGFDPAKAADEATILAVGKLYEGLYQYDYWTRPYRVVPLLADGMPDVTPDGLQWTLRLRPGIRFADDPCFAATSGRGRPVTAADFVYSLLRIADVKVGSSGYWLFRGRIEGLDDFRAASQTDAPTDYDAPVAGLRALDDRTIQLRLTAPYPQLLWALAMPYTFIVPREAVETYGPDFPLHPVGTGPYILASARPNYRYEYRANPAWTDPDTPRTDTVPADAPTPDAGRPLPLVPRIVASVVGDPSTAWLLFLTGDLDRTSVTLDQWDSIIAPDQTLRPEIASRGIALSRTPTLGVSYIAFNMDDPVLGPNRKLRQALACAFDLPAWLRFQNGRMAPADGPVPPGVAGAAETPNPCSYDLGRAKRLLAEAGYPGGRDPATGRRLVLTLDIGSADNPEEHQGAELIASFFDKIGIQLHLSFNNWPTFLKKIQNRQCQLFKLIWLGDYPDAQNFLQLFHTPNASPGPNRANYTNPAFDALYEQMTATPDGPSRNALCRSATDILREDCPWIFIAYPNKYSLRHTRLRNDLPTDFPWGTEKYLALP